MPEWYLIDSPGDVLENDARSCCLPGVECRTCGQTWAELGIGYPTVGCKELPLALPTSGWPMPAADLIPMRDALRRSFGDGRPLEPGTDFGTLTGLLMRKPPDVFSSVGAFLVSERIAEDPGFRALGLRLARTVTHTKRGKKRFVVYEIEAWALAQRKRRSDVRIKAPCRVCGFQRFPGYRGEPLIAASLKGHHALRLAELTPVQLVSGELKAVLDRYAPEGVTYRRVRVT